MRKAALSLLLFLPACSRKPPEPFSRTVEEFIYTTLAWSPVLASNVGYRQHQGVALDEQLDDYSAAGIEMQRKFYNGFQERLKRMDPGKLDAGERADYDILNDQVALILLEFDTIQNYRHNPTVYVELIGNALFSPYVLEYAPKEQRFRHIIERLKKVPALVAQARANLADAAEIWNTVAQEENDGNIGLIDETLRKDVPESLRSSYEQAAGPALDALRQFNLYLKNEMSKKPGDWRLGKEKYSRKFRYALATDKTPEQVLAEAEAELTAVRRQMFETSLPLHKKWYPSHKDPVDLNLIVSETLDKIAQKHATPSTYFADARRDLQEVREFVKAKNIVSLPPRDNLQVIDTPEFMRGIYSVGGFSSAPALEPHLGAFYWLTPIPGNWPKERVESKLREYNFYSLKILTIHEAIPGHYVQQEYANDIQPQWRRLLRGIFGNGPYVEGWAVYATEVMLEEGYLDGSPELRLTFQKQQLRMLANAILDVRMQTMNMTDQEAMDLMLNKTFQEKEEATGKLRRAKLSSTQLPTYYVGWKDWHRVRQHYRAQAGGSFRLAGFHERVLKEGAVPLPVLARLLTGKPL
jgi:uncharacterized protein (DUF885 family)